MHIIGRHPSGSGRQGNRISEQRRVAERDIAVLQPQVTEAASLRRRIANSTAGADVVVAERAHTGSALQVLATITELMPDDTVLSEMSLRQGQLGISGYSQGAARLIRTLAGNPLIRNPSFVAPVTRSSIVRPTMTGVPASIGSSSGGSVEQEPVDQFSIRAELSP